MNFLNKITLKLESLYIGLELSLYKVKSTEKIKNFSLFESEADKITKIVASLPKLERIALTRLLRNNVDIFIWTIIDMLGIDPLVIVHSLNVTAWKNRLNRRKENF